MAMRLLLYDRFDQYIREIPFYTGSHDDEINGEDQITFTSDIPLSPGDRIIWQDGDRWREHVVDSFVEDRSNSDPYSYTCVNSLQYDWRLAHVSYADFEDGNAAYCVHELCKLTSWEMGDVADTDTADELELMKMSAWEAFIYVRDKFGLEMEPIINVDDFGVVGRRVSLKERIGQKTNIRFDYEYGLEGITREVLDTDIITLCYGYGESYGSGEDSSLTFEDINGGKPYVCRNDLLEQWGLPDGHGGLRHAEGFYENTDCDDEEVLLQETIDYLNKHCEPDYTYEANIPVLWLEGANLGDTILVVNHDMDPVLRLEARIAKRSRDLQTGITNSATFGTVVSLLSGALVRAIDMNRQASKNAARLGGLTTSYDDLKKNIEDLNKNNQQQFEDQASHNETTNKEIQGLQDQLKELMDRLAELENPKEPDEPEEPEEGGEG